jgi:type IV pilus assembly protein PilB
MNSLEKDFYSEILQNNILTKDDLEEAVVGAGKGKIPLYTYLQQNKVVPERTILKVLADLINIPYLNLKNTVIEELALHAVPVKMAWHYEIMPVSLNGNVLTIAVNAPLSVRRQDEIRLNLGFKVEMVLSEREQILDLLKSNYGIAADTVERMVKDGRGDSSVSSTRYSHEKIDDIEKLVEDASVVKLVNQIILEAYNKRATDIHIEPYRGRLVLRYRIDGRLKSQMVPDDFNRFLAPILSRIKIMANLNIVERRIPQDGRAIVRIQNQVLDLRISFMPTPHGESVVIRILPSTLHLKLETLGLAPDDVVTLDRLLKKTSGIIFVTGPTGSGKTTSLYAGIDKINTPDKKILTIEDPIEYGIEGVTQIQVAPRVGLTFAQGLRSMLRQDPDVIMVGEVRDKETAEIAIRVALTGHLVLSTLHTNDAASGVTRLLDIGIQPYLISSTIQAFIAQRLVRVICPECKIEDTAVSGELREEMAKYHFIDDPVNVKIFRGRGCEKCEQTGYFGRTAIYEILTVDNEIRKMIADKCSALEINKRAIAGGMKTLLEDGWRNVIAGITTPEEVMKAAKEIDLAAGLEHDDDLSDPDTAGSVAGHTIQ